MDQATGRHWFGIRKSLDQTRAAMLTVLSFVLPLTFWCVASYGPWWDVAHQVIVSADSPNLQSVYIVGDRLEPGTWNEFVAVIRRDNEEIQRARHTGGLAVATERQNKKILRQIHETAVANGWLTRDQETDDEAIGNVWLKLASGDLHATRPPLSEENRKIVVENAVKLGKSWPGWPSESFLKLIPESSTEVSRPPYLVPPDVVARSFWEGITAGQPGKLEAGEQGAERKTLLQRYSESLRTIVLGFLLAMLVAIPLGILAGTFDFFSRVVEPFVNFFSYMPAPAFGVVLMAIFGLNSGPKIMLVFLGTLPGAVLMIAKTTRRLDSSLLEAAQTLGANQRQLINHVVIPGILPNLYNDLRLLFGSAWTWLVIAELLGFKSGLSEVIDTHGRRFQFDLVYPAILLIGLSGFCIDQILAFLAKYFFPWMSPPKQGFLGRLGARFGRMIRAAVPVAPAPSSSVP